jgi:hypothetical protein
MAIQYASGSRVYTTFSGQTKNDMLANMFTQLPNAGWSIVSGITPSVVTMTSANPGVVTLTSHGLANGTRVVFTTTGALPTNITANTVVYFIVNATTNTFQVATTLGGTGINTTSGTQSGTHTMNSEIVFQTATTPQSYAIRCRMRDNGGTCVQFSIETTDGYLVGGNSTSVGGSARPASGKTWIIVANQYQFLLWVQGDFNVGAEFILVSCPYVPSFLTGIKYIGIMQSAARGDGTGCNGCSGNWRYTLTGNFSDGSQNWYQVFYHYNMLDSVTSPGSGNTPGELNFVQNIFPTYPGSNSNTIWRYANGDLASIDALLYWGVPAINNEPMLRCQLWDALVIVDTAGVTGDTTTSFDSHNWIAVTSSITSSTTSALWVVTP